ncbi:MAG: DNA glycosylase AlkZ-like family protein, partial [Natronosporangium sp.]
LAQVGKEPPILEDGPRFRVTLAGGRGDEAFARYINGASFPAELSGDLDILMVLTALRHSKRVAASDLTGRLQRNPGDVERVLRRMHAANLVHPTTRGTRGGQHPEYTLTAEAVAGMRASISYRLATVDADEQKLIRHLRRHGRITNEDVRGYLDCDAATARNRLTSLRRRGLIDFAPDSPRRGPHVIYARTAALDGAGPNH